MAWRLPSKERIEAGTIRLQLVGGALLRTLTRAGVNVLGTCWAQNRTALQTLDIRNKDQVKSCFDTAKPDVVFLAANTPGGVDFCEEHSTEPHELNIRGTANVTTCAAETGTRVVYYSTDYIFDGARGPYSEED